MAPVLHELAGNGRGQQVLAATVVVTLTTILSTGVSFWWTEQAEQKLHQFETEAQQARRDLAVDLRRDIQSTNDNLAYRIKTLEDRLQRMDVIDGAIQSLITQEMRSIREELGKKVGIDDRNETARRRDQQMSELWTRVRELERLMYGARTP